MTPTARDWPVARTRTLVLVDAAHSGDQKPLRVRVSPTTALDGAVAMAVNAMELVPIVMGSSEVTANVSAPRSCQNARKPWIRSQYHALR